jgi:hypothetical protein
LRDDVRRRWIDALRSGSYRQTKECLQSCDGSYCCLGVLLDAVYRPNHPAEAWTPARPGRLAFDGDDAELSPRVRAWAGLGYDEMIDLIRMNDTIGLDFPAIAQVLETGLTLRMIRRLKDPFDAEASV